MIVISRQADGINIEGHAGFAPSGKDIVCAGVSTLVTNLVNSIEELTEDTIEYETGDGYIIIKHGNLSEGASLLVDSFLLGIEEISTNYPQYVGLKKECNKDGKNDI